MDRVVEHGKARAREELRVETPTQLPEVPFRRTNAARGHAAELGRTRPELARAFALEHARFPSAGGAAARLDDLHAQVLGRVVARGNEEPGRTAPAPHGVGRDRGRRGPVREHRARAGAGDRPGGRDGRPIGLEARVVGDQHASRPAPLDRAASDCRGERADPIEREVLA